MTLALHLTLCSVSSVLPLSLHTALDANLRSRVSLRSLIVHSRTHNQVVAGLAASTLSTTPRTGPGRPVSGSLG